VAEIAYNATKTKSQYAALKINQAEKIFFQRRRPMLRHLRSLREQYYQDFGDGVGGNRDLRPR